VVQITSIEHAYVGVFAIFRKPQTEYVEIVHDAISNAAKPFVPGLENILIQDQPPRAPTQESGHFNRPLVGNTPVFEKDP
jgi:hypothetical protein